MPDGGAALEGGAAAAYLLKGYDSDNFRQACRDRGSEPIIPRRKTTGAKGLDKPRHVVEQAVDSPIQNCIAAIRLGGNA
jgi:hypothetical protein